MVIYVCLHTCAGKNNCVNVCVRERERERESVSVCVQRSKLILQHIEASVGSPVKHCGCRLACVIID